MADQLSAPRRFGRFPIMNGPSVPWEVMEPHEAQAQRNHSQSLERLAERGGLSSAEAWYVVNSTRGEWDTISVAQANAAWQRYADVVNQRYGQLARRIVALERVANAAKEFRHAADRDLTGWSTSADVCHWDAELLDALRITESATSLKAGSS